MVTILPSRFAVLNIEDDEVKPNKQTSQTNKFNGKKGEQKQKPQQQQKKDDKKKTNKGKKKKSNNDDKQWEQWKQKDSMAVEETYEDELHQAILLSKLSFELESSTTKSNKDSDASSKKSSGNKKSKKSTMSLEEFNNLKSSASNSTVTDNDEPIRSKEYDCEFFEKLDKEVKMEIDKGKEKELLKSRASQIDEDITLAQLKVELENRDVIIKQLQKDNESLKEELTQVKKRNKKLYQILSQGEMKDKASVLVEVTKLNDIRDELTAEVASLHAQLEQERSKTRTATVDSSKSTKQTAKKRSTSENA